ncbi:MAG: cadherin-like domain-containing protein, partial [Pseudomonadales bacterium]|nr:cadherin-like domain-containing protein [Pseudomonadales bacterium]
GSQGLYYISGSISPNQSNNNAPQAQNDSASTTEDQTVNIAVLSNDSDIDGDTLALSQVNNGTLGTTQIQGGTIEYTPFANANGTDQFSYTIIDGQGGSATATVTVSISAVNDAPVALNDSETLSQDSSSMIAVLNNDSDPDGDALTVTAVNQPANGTATINGNSINYTPASGYTGPDSFTYTISDTGGLTSTATVSVFVNELVEPPVTPANFIAVDGTDGAAHLSWTDTDNETGFEIQRETKHKKRNTWNGTTTVASPSQDTTVYSDNVGTGTFRYRARSSNSEGVSPWSAWSQVTVTDASGGGDSGGSGGGKGGGKGRNK